MQTTISYELKKFIKMGKKQFYKLKNNVRNHIITQSGKIASFMNFMKLKLNGVILHSP